MGCGRSKTETFDTIHEKPLNVSNPTLIQKELIPYLKKGCLMIDYETLIKSDLTNGKRSNRNFFDFEVDSEIFKSRVKFFGKAIRDMRVVNKLLNLEAKSNLDLQVTQDLDRYVITSLRSRLKEVSPDFEIGIQVAKGAKGEKILYLILMHPYNSLSQMQSIDLIFSNNKMSSMKKLYLTDITKLSFSHLISLLNALKTNHTLKSLIMSSLGLMDDLTLMILMGNLALNPGITKLKMRECALSKENLGIMNFLFQNKGGSINTDTQPITRLVFSWNKIESLDAIKNYVGNSPLECLGIFNNKIIDFSAISEIVAKCIHSLRKLKIPKCQLRTEENFSKIFSSKFLTDTNYSLEFLDLSFNYVNFLTLAKMISSMKHLRMLTLQRPSIDETDQNVLEAITNFAKTFVNLPHVKMLKINFKTEEALVSFSKGLCAYDNCTYSGSDIRALKIFKTLISEAACRDLFPQIRIFHHVDLSHCTIGDYEALQKAFTIGDNINVQELNLANCNIKEEDYKALSKFIAKSKTIMRIDLEDNIINENVASIFSEALSHNSSLKKLKLNYCFSDYAFTSVNMSQTPSAFSIFCENTIFKTLEELHIEHCELQPAILGLDFAKLLERNANLRILRIGSKDENFKNAVNIAILEALKLNHVLEEISISNIRLPMEKINLFLIDQQDTLKIIELTNVFLTNINEAEQVIFAENLTSVKHLERVSIIANGMTNLCNTGRVNDAIGKLLFQCRTLKSFQLALSDLRNFKPEYLQRIIEGIKENTVLKIFKILFGEAGRSISIRNPICFMPVDYANALDVYYRVISACKNIEDFSLLLLTNEDMPRVDMENMIQKAGKVMVDFLNFK